MGDQSGREVCTIAVDESGAPRRTVRLAFELYSTGEYSLERPAQTLTDRGYKHEAQTLSGWTDLDGTAGRNTSGPLLPRHRHVQRRGLLPAAVSRL